MDPITMTAWSSRTGVAFAGGFGHPFRPRERSSGGRSSSAVRRPRTGSRPARAGAGARHGVAVTKVSRKLAALI